MIVRFSNNNSKSGILLKFPKNKQDLKTDLPTIGIKTLKKCSTIGLKGVVLKSKQNILNENYVNFCHLYVGYGSFIDDFRRGKQQFIQ